MLPVFSFKPQQWDIYRSGEHISLNPVNKVDGILAKIFIYNILQQRLDRLLLAVLRRKRGRSVHEWDSRLGWGSAGGVVQGEELRTRQTGEYIKEAEGEDSTYCRILNSWLVTRWEVKMHFIPFRWDFFFKESLSYLKWGQSELKNCF